MLDALARSRDVRGPYNVGTYVREQTGRGPQAHSSAWSQIFYGEVVPKPQTITAFRDAFKLTEDEEARLALLYTFRTSSKFQEVA
jgi:hypothetical protein